MFLLGTVKTELSFQLYYSVVDVPCVLIPLASVFPVCSAWGSLSLRLLLGLPLPALRLLVVRPWIPETEMEASS